MLVWNKWEQILGNHSTVLAVGESERLQLIVLQVI